jgi:hypothetical protein
VSNLKLGEENEMSNYTQEELQGMSRVQLRRAAIEMLKIDNKEASNSKSGDLIDRILEMGEGGGNGNGSSKEAAKGPAKRSTRRTTRKTTAAKEETAEATPANGVGKLVDAVGKAVDETKEELISKSDDILENIDHIMKQQFILFGILCDVYKAGVDGPDALDARLEELEEAWNAQGNEG